MAKYTAMKKILLLLLLTTGAYAQPEVFNVQKYCVDELPFKKSECDISGNEYSFVFLDSKKKEVVFFFTNTKLKYKITGSQTGTSDPGTIIHKLEGEAGRAEMKINKQKTRIEFLYSEMHIYLTVGKSTKMEG
jgi:hypothetical protein